jgi:hypothetical protein
VDGIWCRTSASTGLAGKHDAVKRIAVSDLNPPKDSEPNEPVAAWLFQKLTGTVGFYS